MIGRGVATNVAGERVAAGVGSAGKPVATAAGVAGKCGPSVEQMLHAYAYGKPVERVELGHPGDFSFLNSDPFHIDTYIHCGA